MITSLGWVGAASVPSAPWRPDAANQVIAAIRVDSEADAQLLAKYDVRDSKIFVLVKGS
jgi:hypothetical protein